MELHELFFLIVTSISGLCFEELLLLKSSGGPWKNIGSKEIFWGDPIGVVCLDISNGDNKVGFKGEPHLELDGGRVDTDEHLVDKFDWLRLKG